MEVIFKGLATATGVTDNDALRLQANQSKAHCHAVVVVGVYLAGFRRAGIDGNTARAVHIFIAADAHLGKLCHNGMDAVTFLKTDMSDAGDGGGCGCKGSDGGQSDSLI